MHDFSIPLYCKRIQCNDQIYNNNNKVLSHLSTSMPSTFWNARSTNDHTCKFNQASEWSLSRLLASYRQSLYGQSMIKVRCSLFRSKNDFCTYRLSTVFLIQSRSKSRSRLYADFQDSEQKSKSLSSGILDCKMCYRRKFSIIRKYTKVCIMNKK
jgi:hypothetical protein